MQTNKLILVALLLVLAAIFYAIAMITIDFRWGLAKDCKIVNKSKEVR